MGILGTALNVGSWALTIGTAPETGGLSVAGRIGAGLGSKLLIRTGIHAVEDLVKIIKPSRLAEIKHEARQWHKLRTRKNFLATLKTFTHPPYRRSPIFDVKRNDREWNIMSRFLHREKIKDTIEYLQGDCALALANYLQKEVVDRIPKTPEERFYRKSFSVVQKRDDVVLWANPRRVQVGSLSPEKWLMYFEEAEDAVKNTRYGTWLVKNSPFVLGMISKFSGDLDVFVRKANTGEIVDTRTENLRLMREMHTVMLSSSPKELKPITNVRIDIAFHGMRLEYGLGGYRHKPHWRPALRKMTINKDKVLAPRVNMIMNPNQTYHPLKPTKMFKAADYWFTNKITKGQV